MMAFLIGHIYIITAGRTPGEAAYFGSHHGAIRKPKGGAQRAARAKQRHMIPADTGQDLCPPVERDCASGADAP